MLLELILHFGDGVVEGSKSGNRDSVLVDDEFGEVPLDEVAQQAALLGLEELE